MNSDMIPSFLTRISRMNRIPISLSASFSSPSFQRGCYKLDPCLSSHPTSFSSFSSSSSKMTSSSSAPTLPSPSRSPSPLISTSTSPSRVETKSTSTNTTIFSFLPIQSVPTHLPTPSNPNDILIRSSIPKKELAVQHLTLHQLRVLKRIQESSHKVKLKRKIGISIRP